VRLVGTHAESHVALGDLSDSLVTALVGNAMTNRTIPNDLGAHL
jgi:hypothetical protein